MKGVTAHNGRVSVIALLLFIVQAQETVTLANYATIFRVGNNIGWGFGPAIGGFIESFSGYHPLHLSRKG